MFLNVDIQRLRYGQFPENIKTIAQDQESSVVFGMPKAAIEQGAAMEVLPLGEIGGKINKELSL